MKKLTVLVMVLLLLGCGEIMHGPKDTMTQEHSLTMSELNVVTDISCCPWSLRYGCHQGFIHMEQKGLCLLLSR